MNVSVSVVIPCYNVEAFVAEAVRSAVGQSRRPLEVICVDDGSTDGTLQVLRDLDSEHPGLVRVLTGPNRGAPAARNRGLAEAGGEYIQFLDADDVLDPEKLNYQLDLAASHGFPDLIVGSHTHEASTGAQRVQEVVTGNPWVRLMESGMGITSANLWKREAVASIGGWNEAQKSSQEYELMFRMLASGVTVAFDNKSHTTIRERGGSISRNEQADLVALDLRGRIIRYLLEHGELNGETMEAVLNAGFRVVRRLYPRHPREAVAAYREFFPPTFSPRPDGYTTRSYVLVYRALGFRGAEWVKRAVGRG